MRRIPDWWGLERIRPWLLGVGLAASAGFAAPMIAPQPAPTNVAPPLQLATIAQPARPLPKSRPAPAVPAAMPSAAKPEPAWTRVQVGSGDSLSTIFQRMGLGAGELDAVMASGDDAAQLHRLLPGQGLEFQIDAGHLMALRFEPNPRHVLEIRRDGDTFSGSMSSANLDTRVQRAEAHITSSLFNAGQDAGLSDKLIMELAGIFGWEIDFALDIRENDSFKVIYEEFYKGDRKVADGPILAAEFSNNGEVYRAVRYTDPDGRTDYFAPDGQSLRTAFLRTPLNFTRISSGFNLHRKHPILNTIRAHVGVDYAAPSGTPVRATGDGTVIYAARKGGYGNTIILRHGNGYRTLYAHLSRFAGGVGSGKRVRQGETIGYVGMTGLATGPHLHYEFQVNGVHRNPLTISLPRAAPVAREAMAQFESTSREMLAELDHPGSSGLAMAKQESLVPETVSH